MKKLITFSVIVAVAATLVYSCTSENNKVAAAEPISKDSLIKRGEYLVTIMSCNDCHSPVGPGHVPDPERLLSGHPSDVPVMPFDTATSKRYAL